MSEIAERWSNWAGNQTARPRRVAHPRGTDEITAAVTSAAVAGLRVKPIGAGQSFTGVGVTDGALLHLDRHNRVLDVDVERGQVTVEGGITIRALAGELASVGLALPTLGGGGAQSISGAINTGTHGTGLRVGGLATQVRALDLVIADGSLLHCSTTENADLFAAALVGLGAFGVVAAYTLQTIPAFAVHAAHEPAAFGELVDDGRFAEVAQTADYTGFSWFPHTSVCRLTSASRVGLDALAPRNRWQGRLEGAVGSHPLIHAATTVGTVAPALIPTFNRLAAATVRRREYVAASDLLSLAAPRVRFVEMEYGVPRAALADVLRDVRGFVDASGLEVSLPVEVRVAAADDIWLSTCFERESAYIAVRMVRGIPYDRYFHGVERILRQVAGRPHWGTMHTLDAASLDAVYPRFQQARTIRDRVDPDRVFSNDYSVRVLGR